MCTMEEIMMNKKHTCSSTTKSLTMHKDSHLISKNKPKIRIIHIFAPEIIKTDVANFRELVQRLTGKPTEKKKLRPRKETHKTPAMKMDTLVGSDEVMVREKIKGEEEIWVGANSGGGFLGGFGDLDGFMHDGFAPILPNLDYSFGERSINLSTYS